MIRQLVVRFNLTIGDYISKGSYLTTILRSRSPINKTIVENRSGIAFDQLVGNCIEQLEMLDNRRILQGLGELLTPGQKDWARAKLKEETIALLKLRIG